MVMRNAPVHKAKIEQIDLDRIAEATGYDHVGLRVDDADYARGSIVPDSREWHDNSVMIDHLCLAADGRQYGNDTDCDDEDCLCCDGDCACDARLMAGTCALANLATAADYDGRWIYILGSNHAEAGNDLHEIIMREPRVLARIAR